MSYRRIFVVCPPQGKSRGQTLALESEHIDYAIAACGTGIEDIELGGVLDVNIMCLVSRLDQLRGLRLSRCTRNAGRRRVSWQAMVWPKEHTHDATTSRCWRVKRSSKDSKGIAIERSGARIRFSTRSPPSIGSLWPMRAHTLDTMDALTTSRKHIAYALRRLPRFKRNLAGAKADPAMQGQAVAHLRMKQT